MDYTCQVATNGLGAKTERYSLRSDLPAQFTYRVMVYTYKDATSYSSTSCRGSNGSTRHYVHTDLESALDHGLKWARRQRVNDRVVNAARHAAVAYLKSDGSVSRAAFLKDWLRDEKLAMGERMLEKTWELALFYSMSRRFEVEQVGEAA